MQTVPIHQAKDRLSALLQAVEDGEEVVITRHGRRIARIVREVDEVPPADELQRRRNEAIERLRAYQAQARLDAPVDGWSDWKSLRDAGRAR
jgi:prevent-host-death family protein